MDLRPGDETAAIGEAVIVYLEAITDPDSGGDFEVEVLMPYNDSAPLAKICSLAFYDSGANIPCVKPVEANYTARNGDANYDRAVLSGVRINNFGFKTDDPDANKVRFFMIVKVS